MQGSEGSLFPILKAISVAAVDLASSTVNGSRAAAAPIPICTDSRWASDLRWGVPEDPPTATAGMDWGRELNILDDVWRLL